MATIKVKFRPSSVDGKEGTLYYQVIHNRVVRKIGTGYRLAPDEWSEGEWKSPLTGTASGRGRYLAALRSFLQQDMARLAAIVKVLEQSGEAYTTEQVVDAFRASGASGNLLGIFTRAVAKDLKNIGKERLSETYLTSLNSFLRFRGILGDVRLEEMDSDMMLAYEAYLKACGLVPNTTSLYA